MLEQQFDDDVDTILRPSGIEHATYTVAANNFLTGGGDDFTTLEEGTNPETLGSDLDALVEYIGLVAALLRTRGLPTAHNRTLAASGDPSKKRGAVAETTVPLALARLDRGLYRKSNRK